MENGLDLTLRLGLPIPTVETHLSSHHTLTTHDQVYGGPQVNNGRAPGIFGGEIDMNEEDARNGVNINISVYNHAFQLFAGIGNTLDFTPHPMQPYAPPQEVDYVFFDVPARRAERNHSLAMANAIANANPPAAAAANVRRPPRREMVGMRQCTNRNCKTGETPMWRRGPLGPKTLCNACGIKFRKELERKAKKNKNNGV